MLVTLSSMQRGEQGRHRLHEIQTCMCHPHLAVLEEVIQDEIIDETDTFESNEHSVPVVRRPGRDRPDVSSYLALFEHKIRDQNRLSPPEVQAVSAFLLTAVPEFSIFASMDAVLKVWWQLSLSVARMVARTLLTGSCRRYLACMASPRSLAQPCVLYWLHTMPRLLL